MTGLKYLVQVQSRDKKSLKMQTGQSEVVNPRRTDNEMAKRTRANGQTKIYKALHRKLKIEKHEHL